MPKANMHSQLVRDGIAKLRRKLLDLTNNNRLLNFKFSDTSRRFVRIVDELPDVLFERLTDDAANKRLYFQSLPELPLQNSIEDPTNKNGELTLEYQENSGGRRTTKEPRVNLAEWARKHNIDPSYDLPSPNGTMLSKHGDNQIQTLLLPEPMERKLAAIRDDANLATQELGLSTLYAAFGYLEWYESEISEEVRFAPLMLLPLQIDRELKQHRYKYFVAGGDASEAISNISLAERLKRDFGFQLPAITENDTPEKYFHRVTSSLRQFPRWKVRRFVCIGHFSFSRLVMYEDLSEAAWQTAPLEENSLIANLLAGADRDESGGDSLSDFDVESEEVERLVPALITDADSSQHAAIVDAMQGRSFALKGPPGTGKSQTITNLISAFLAAGKKVLFVAEKQAALDVVAERLGDAGLSPYLLELHSTKVQKRQVLASFEARLKIRRRKENEELEETLSNLRQTRSRLWAYVTSMNSVVSNSGLTLHNAYWEEQGARRALPTTTPELIRGLENETYAELPESSFASQSDLIDRLAKAFRVCQAGGHIKSHPLFGIQNLGVSADDTYRLRSYLQELRDAIDKLKRICSRRDAMLGAGLPNTLDQLRDFSSISSKLPAISSTLDFRLLEVIGDRDGLDALGKFTKSIKHFVQERLTLQNAVDNIDEFTSAADALARRFPVLARELSDFGLDALPINAIGESLLKQRLTIENTKGAVNILERFQVAAGISTAMSCVHLVEMAQAISYLKTLPANVLVARDRHLAEPTAKEELERYWSDATVLNERKVALSTEVKFPADVDSRELDEAAAMLRETKWLGVIFSSRYRLAKRTSMRVRITPWKGRIYAAAQLSQLAEWIEQKKQFESQQRLRHLAGRIWKGLETPFERLSDVADFYDRVRKKWPSLDPVKQPIQSMLTGTDATLLMEVADSISDARLSNIRELEGLLAKSGSSSASEALSELERKVVQSTSLLAEVRPERFHQPLGLSQVSELIRRCSALAYVDKQIRDDKFARSIRLTSIPDESTIKSTTEALDYCSAIFALPLPPQLQRQLLTKKAPTIRQALVSMGNFTKDSVGAIDDANKELTDTFELQASAWLGTSQPERVTVKACLDRVDCALSASDSAIGEWSVFRDLVFQGVQAGLSQFVTLLETEQVSHEYLLGCYRSTYFRSLIKHATKLNPNITRWTGEAIENQRSRLRSLDKEYAERSRQHVFTRLSAAQIPEGVAQGPVADKTDRALIEHEIGKQRRHIAIRELMRRASAAAHAAKPCFMMSPASVAQFLPAERDVFDVAIIDEASQMRPEEALGVLARARQAVIVGDPMQLPPTTFFDASHEEASDSERDELDVDAESVLDLALSSFRPSRELQWHYRSQHHSLIAFSNREFYDDNLIVFPSPVERSDQMGVENIYVQDATYGSSVNVREVGVVVETVSKMIRTNPKRSIGVVAVNQPQKELLRQEFDKVFAENGDLEDFRAHWEGTLHSFFVKNLENVQGDERDAIVISTVYGPAEAGAAVMQRFGPINSKTGHRRLNVLFTRAKQRVVLVTSMKPEDIVATSGSSRGVIALKNYLAYARSGRLEHGTATGGSYDSPFEKEVAEVVHQLGYRTSPQIGVAGFFIDLGVRHPINSEHFFLGIECDGASYHSAKSARDRDRLRHEILERLGWNLYRIWSTDWFRSRDREVKKLADHLRLLSRGES